MSRHFLEVGCLHEDLNRSSADRGNDAEQWNCMITIMKYMDEFRNRAVATALIERIKKIVHRPLSEHRRFMLIVNEKRPSIIY